MRIEDLYLVEVEGVLSLEVSLIWTTEGNKCDISKELRDRCKLKNGLVLLLRLRERLTYLFIRNEEKGTPIRSK